MERDYFNAVEAGRRNQEAKELIHNWCRHARVEKFGGVGLIEQQTGFPIGHHAMACDFAPASGMMMWSLEEAALQFHDANCVGCPKREPVGLPNLSKLVAQRDHDVALARAQAEESRRQADAAFAARCAARDAVRASASVAVATFLDDLRAFDADRSDNNARRLIESACLAPEILTPELTEHLFSLLESGEHWFDAMGLTILANYAPGRVRLTRCAMRCLSTRALDIAGTIVSERISDIDAADVADAIIGLACLASPPRPDFPGHHGNGPEPNAVPLQLVAAAFPEQAMRGFDALLAHKDDFQVALAARALASFVSKESRWRDCFVRNLAALLSRADRLIDVDRDSEMRSVTHDLTESLAQAYLGAPAFTDAELMRQFESASPEGEGRLADVYEHVLRRAKDRENKVAIADVDPYRLVLTQLVVLAESSENSEVIQQLLSALRHPPASLAPLAKQMMDLFLGAAAVIDTKVNAPDTDSVVVAPKNPFEAMDRQTRRWNLRSLRDCFIAWAVRGASLDASGLAAFEAFLSRRASFSESLEAALIEESHPLFKTNAGLAAMLPYLYSAMVGPSTLARAAGAKAIEEMGSRQLAELPSLVIEAFLMMLTDPYVIVHKTAVRTLRRVTLPDDYKKFVSYALQNLIVGYRHEKDQEFLLDCIEAYGRGHRNDEQFLATDGKVFVAILGEIKPAHLLRSGHHHYLGHLAQAEGYPELILGLFAHCREDYELERALELVGNFPLGAAGSRLPLVLKTVATDPRGISICGTFVEILARDGAWEGAVEVAKLRVDAIPETPRERASRLFAQQLLLRAQFEYLLSLGKWDEALALREGWDLAEKELAANREHNEKSYPFGPLLRSPPRQ